MQWLVISNNFTYKNVKLLKHFLSQSKMEMQSRMLSAFSSAGSQTRKGFSKLANGGFSTFVKIMMIIITVYVICISATNIAAYAYILRRPGNDSDINDTWCIALIVLNVILMIASLAILIIVIISFFRKGGEKVEAVVNQASMQGAMQGAQIAAQVEATNKAEAAKMDAIENGSTKAGAEAIAQETFRREILKKAQEYRQKIMESQTQPTQPQPLEIDPAQAYAIALGLGLQPPPGYLM
jgi:hypothetical protein